MVAPGYSLFVTARMMSIMMMMMTLLWGDCEHVALECQPGNSFSELQRLKQYSGNTSIK